MLRRGPEPGAVRRLAPAPSQPKSLPICLFLSAVRTGTPPPAPPRARLLGESEDLSGDSPFRAGRCGCGVLARKEPPPVHEHTAGPRRKRKARGEGRNTPIAMCGRGVGGGGVPPLTRQEPKRQREGQLRSNAVMKLPCGGGAWRCSCCAAALHD
ncbi:hypothetical protein TraAM80_05995 [Trypanosoma rangeli]|uniref:Uncharacterized protein n=1 Tax=Trypanosoma rangeli TaxID=5698 RepID=A0A3R7MC54_TRYRA|nr:uncharacterized protein TraAM80_05995 [Trypanosoma rangeli]RNF03137.1 hypothetical protein TraAM80_05995 [Trypanosoma rangeli]|eukprot:RNF03137.1 hypothetical protein TraAM80_05995 [Trypanosoma rangeli]